MAALRWRSWTGRRVPRTGWWCSRCSDRTQWLVRNIQVLWRKAKPFEKDANQLRVKLSPRKDIVRAVVRRVQHQPDGSLENRMRPTSWKGKGFYDCAWRQETLLVSLRQLYGGTERENLSLSRKHFSDTNVSLRCTASPARKSAVALKEKKCRWVSSFWKDSGKKGSHCWCTPWCTKCGVGAKVQILLSSSLGSCLGLSLTGTPENSLGQKAQIHLFKAGCQLWASTTCP